MKNESKLENFSVQVEVFNNTGKFNWRIVVSSTFGKKIVGNSCRQGYENRKDAVHTASQFKDYGGVIPTVVILKKYYRIN